MKVRLFSILFILTIYNNFLFAKNDICNGGEVIGTPEYVPSISSVYGSKVDLKEFSGGYYFEYEGTFYYTFDKFKPSGGYVGQSQYAKFSKDKQVPDFADKAFFKPPYVHKVGSFVKSYTDSRYEGGGYGGYFCLTGFVHVFNDEGSAKFQSCPADQGFDEQSGKCYDSCKLKNNVLGNFETIKRNSDGSVSGSECNDCSKASSEAEYLDCACKANGGIGFNGSHPGVTLNGHYSPSCVSKDGTTFDIFIPNFKFRGEPSNTEFKDTPNSKPTDPTNTGNNGGTANPGETGNTGNNGNTGNTGGSGNTGNNTGGSGGDNTNDNNTSTGSTGGSGSIGSETTINDNNTTHIGGNTSPVTPNTPKDNNTSNTETTTKPINKDSNGTSNNGNYLDTLNKILTELDSLNKKTEELITGDKDMIKSYNEFSKALSSDPDHPFNDGVGDEYKEIEIMKRGQKYFEYLNEANEKHQKELTENIKDYKDDITSQLDNFKNGAENLKETVLNPLKNPGSSTITKSCPKPVNVTSNSGFSAYTEIDVCKEISRVEPIMYTFFYLLFFGFFLFLLYKIVYRFAL